MKRLYRSKTQRVLGGVCGGLGEHLDVDPTVIRLALVLVTLISLGTGLLLYLIAWIIVPEEEAPDTGFDSIGKEYQG